MSLKDVYFIWFDRFRPVRVFGTKPAPQSPPCAGMEAKQLFAAGTSYTYDDVIFHPGYIDFAADQV